MVRISNNAQTCPICVPLTGVFELGSHSAPRAKAVAAAVVASGRVAHRSDAAMDVLSSWRLLRDDSRNVKKAAASALAGPESKEERRQLWEILHHEPDMGVRGQLANVLLASAKGDSLDDWIPLATDSNWTARWCAAKMRRDHHPDAPRLDYAFLPEEIEKKAQPVLDWYRMRKQSS